MSAHSSQYNIIIIFFNLLQYNSNWVTCNNDGMFDNICKAVWMPKTSVMKCLFSKYI